VEIDPRFFVGAWSVLGLIVGSFLNVAIHRLPLEGQSVLHPRRSRCPSCGHEIAAWENVPVVSWLFLRGRCSACRWRIPLRYPLVELLSAALWGLSAFLAPSFPIALVWSVVLSGLVVATFVDFDCFEIPDEISLGGLVLAPIASFLVPRLHESTWIARELSGGEVDRTGAFLGSLAGIAVGGGILLAVGWIGKRVFGREAMGLGDVKLLAAGGGFVGPGGACLALLLASLIASLAGAANIARFFCLSRARVRKRRTAKRALRSLAAARIAGRYLPFGPYLGIGIGIVLVAWKDVARLLNELAF
jgi:leader peptidase (prepilin peptidase)/N-methyltransferase